MMNAYVTQLRTVLLPELAQDIAGKLVAPVCKDGSQIFEGMIVPAFLLSQLLIVMIQMVCIGAELATPQYMRIYKIEKKENIVVSLLLLCAAVGNIVAAGGLALSLR